MDFVTDYGDDQGMGIIKWGDIVFLK